MSIEFQTIAPRIVATLPSIDDQTVAGRLVAEGLTHAAALGNPIARARHLGAWALRVSKLDPGAAAALLPQIPADPLDRASLLVTVIGDRLRRGETDVTADVSAVLELARQCHPEAQLRVLNDLSERAVELAERDRPAALAMLETLIPAAKSVSLPEYDPHGTGMQPRVLACALLGEALLALEDPRGRALVEDAAKESEGLPARDAVAGFAATALLRLDPEPALALLDGMEDPGARLDSRLSALASVPEGVMRERVLAGATEDARLIAHWRGPESLVRLADAVSSFEPERARALFEEALAQVAGSGSQVRSLHQAGVASAVAGFDRDWALRLYSDSEESALLEDEPVRRVTSLAVIADEMSEPFPREAAAVFARAMEEAAGLEAMWEYAHLFDIILRADRSPFLDVSAALPLLEHALGRLSDEDPRVPGVFGIPEVARHLLQVDRTKGIEALQRWFRSAESGGDTDGMIQSAAGIYHSDPEAGRTALTRVRDYLLDRVDCPSMGDFSTAVAGLVPDLVLELAPHIPDRRLRGEAFAAAAIALYPSEPERAVGLIRGLERPGDRSIALMTIVDPLLDTSDRQRPEPLMEDLP